MDLATDSDRTVPSTTVRSDPMRGVAVILLAALLFGAMTVCVRIASQEMSIPQIVFFRFSGAFALLVLIGRGRNLLPKGSMVPALVLRGIVGTAAIALYFRGIQGAGAGLATLLHCTYPVYTALFAAVLLGESFNAWVGLALVLNIVGALAILGPSAELGPAAFTGAIYAAVASVLAGGAVTAARHLRNTESALRITTWFMAVGMILSIPCLLTGLPHFSTTLSLALIAMIVTSVGGQFLLHQGLGFTTATQGSLAAATTVVTSALLEAIFLRSSLTAGMLAGGGLLMAAVALSASRGGE
jgi:drug/metabolite transporter (DMT)-like permease